MGSIEHGHSGNNVHPEIATFKVCETLDLGTQCRTRSTREGLLTFVGVKPAKSFANQQFSRLFKK